VQASESGQGADRHRRDWSGTRLKEPRRWLAESTRKILALPSSSRAWSSCPPTTRRPPSGCWTADTGDRDGHIPRHRHDRPVRFSRSSPTSATSQRGTTRSPAPSRPRPGQPGWVPPTGRPGPSPAAARRASGSPTSHHPAGSPSKDRSAPFHASSSYLLEPTDRRTRLTNTVELEPSSALLRPIGPLAVPRVKAAVARNAGTLKQLLEGARPAAEEDQK
jgi:hypothetical protein